MPTTECKPEKDLKTLYMLSVAKKSVLISKWEIIYLMYVSWTLIRKNKGICKWNNKSYFLDHLVFEIIQEDQ